MANRIAAAVVAHVQTDWQDMLAAFKKLLKTPQHLHLFFDWRGPDFKIVVRQSPQVWNELFDRLEDPIFRDILDTGSDEEMDADESDRGASSTRRKRSLPEAGMFVAITHFQRVFLIKCLESEDDVPDTTSKRRK